MAFDELFLLQLGVQRQRRDWLQHTARPLTAPPERFDAFLAALPFGLGLLVWVPMSLLLPVVGYRSLFAAHA